MSPHILSRQKCFTNRANLRDNIYRLSSKKVPFNDKVNESVVCTVD